ncbi:unnamed protein product [Onchocerca ochengi]|uniref:Major sperm protein n=1 Tax=Onchocerca ochengi TaxID=42157 RepID=A0A182ECS4_ONCOC|nr:unnamed protein product [Onchocerca ochengi]
MFCGEWRDESGCAEKPESLCQKPIEVEPKHYYNSDLIWQKHGFRKVPLSCTEIIKRKQIFEIKKIRTTDSQILLWHFTVSSDTEFSIIKIENDYEKIVRPKITLVSLRIPEQGSIICKYCKYAIRFTNPSRFFISVRLQYVIELCSRKQHDCETNI